LASRARFCADPRAQGFSDGEVAVMRKEFRSLFVLWILATVAVECVLIGSDIKYALNHDR
jgi:hypothetical protein